MCVYSLCPIPDSQQCAKRGSCKHPFSSGTYFLVLTFSSPFFVFYFYYYFYSAFILGPFYWACFHPTKPKIPSPFCFGPKSPNTSRPKPHYHHLSSHLTSHHNPMPLFHQPPSHQPPITRKHLTSPPITIPHQP